MKIVAVIKTFRGDCFAEASLKSIYEHVCGVLYIHEETGWTGRKGNTVRDIVKAFPDPENKIHHVEIDSATQDEQYNVAIEWIARRALEYDYCLLIDTDEVWEGQYWDRAVKHCEENDVLAEPYPALRARMHSYIKSPFYRITPDDPIRPVALVRKSAMVRDALSVRGAGLRGSLMEDVYIHHFCAVRKSLEEVWAKHVASCTIEKEIMADKTDWLQRWNGIPETRDLLPMPKHAHQWAGVVRVKIEDLPEAVRDTEIVQAWSTYPQKAVVYKIDKHDLAKVGLPSDFGSGHPDWRIPSKRNKYEMLRKGPVQSKKEAVRTDEAAQKNRMESKAANEVMSPAQINRKYSNRTYPGKLGVMTIASGEYQWYIPMFLDRLQKEYPQAEPLVYVRGDAVIQEPWRSKVLKVEDDAFPTDGYSTACMRYVYCDDRIRKCDFVLITDCDMLLMKETPPLVDQHMRSCEKWGLGCYDNYISTWSASDPRIPGVHFVTREWFTKTETVRKKYADELRKDGARSYEWDEIMIGRIIRESGLPPAPEVLNLWAHHGIHLGDWRRRLELKLKYSLPDAFQTMYMKRLVEDAPFMEIVKTCAPHLKYLKETFDIFGRI